MSSYTAAAAVTLCASLVTCKSESPAVDVDAAVEVGNSLQIVAGDGQTITQHSRSDLQVRVVDGEGNGVPGVPITFEAAPASSFVLSASLETDAAGNAGTSHYIHAAGQLQVVAQAPDLAPVTFTLNVTASPHTYDGMYDCADPSETHFAIKRVVIAAGSISVPDVIRPPTTATLDESAGSIFIDEQISEGLFIKFSGTLAVDALHRGSGSGTYDIRNFTSPNPIDSGTWSCTRR